MQKIIPRKKAKKSLNYFHAGSPVVSLLYAVLQQAMRLEREGKGGLGLSLLDRINQCTIYFQINFQAFDCILGLSDTIERAGDNTVAGVL